MAGHMHASASHKAVCARTQRVYQLLSWCSIVPKCVMYQSRRDNHSKNTRKHPKNLRKAIKILLFNFSNSCRRYIYTHVRTSTYTKPIGVLVQWATDSTKYYFIPQHYIVVRAWSQTTSKVPHLHQYQTKKLAKSARRSQEGKSSQVFEWLSAAATSIGRRAQIKL